MWAFPINPTLTSIVIFWRCHIEHGWIYIVDTLNPCLPDAKGHTGYLVHLDETWGGRDKCQYVSCAGNKNGRDITSNKQHQIQTMKIWSGPWNKKGQWNFLCWCIFYARCKHWFFQKLCFEATCWTLHKLKLLLVLFNLF